MNNNFSGIILRPSSSDYKLAQLNLLGKSIINWVALSFGDAPFTVVDFDENLEIPVAVSGAVDASSEYTVVLYSDTPLITRKTVLDAINTIEAKGLNVLKMTRGYVFKTEFLLTAEKVYAVSTFFFDEEDFITALSYKQIALISDILRNRILNFHMEKNVFIVDTNSTFIDCDVVIGEDVVIEPGNIIKGKSVIKNKVVLKPNNFIEDCVIDEGATLNSSQLYSSYIGKKTTVGPFAYIRPSSVIGEGCRIGDFVEIKKSVIGDGSKVSHLSYVGDAEIGKKCNIGCGVVFVNYDGKNKFKTKVGDNVFVGSNSNLVAPLLLEDNAFIAAGSTITNDVEDSAMAIARARQVTKPNYANVIRERQLPKSE